MDTLRGPFDGGNPADDNTDWDTETAAPEAESVRELPPEAIGQDERRMQVRAYNHWASLLGENSFPSIEDLEPENLDDFGPNSVVLDFSTGIDDPVVQFLGGRLAEECGVESAENGGRIERLSDVPPRSLLSRITDHYMQIIANQAPIGFEAEFVNERGCAVLYRGILLPFSSDHETIDFIYGVINWKEMADAATADELVLAIDQAIDDSDAADVVEDEDQAHKHHADPVTEWADSPAHESDEEVAEDDDTASQPFETDAEPDSENVASFAERFGPAERRDDLPMPDFGQYGLDEPEDEEDEDEGEAGYSFASLADYIEAPAKKAIDLDAEGLDPDDYRVEDAFGGSQPEEAHNESEPQVSVPASLKPVSQEPPIIADEPEVPELAEDAGLHDCLASARELAQNARVSEDRSRHALYAAVGRAYDFSLAAQDEPDAYEELIEDAGLAVQDRAPMTPIVKLVFGHDYDKTRLTEYAAVLSHAHRLEIERGTLADYLGKADGGLKGVVQAERRLRREESGQEVEAEGDVRAQLAEKLRELEALMLDAISGDGPEFSLVMLRRDGNGNVAMIGEIDDDVALIEKAGKKLVG
jgi:hypothetical protein